MLSPRHLTPIVLLLSIVPVHALTALPKVLQSGKTQHDISSSHGEDVVYRMVVPPGAASLVVSTSGGSGDCDLFTRFGAHPTEDDYDGSGTAWGNAETVKHAHPQAGVWYFALRPYGPFRGLKLSARVSLASGTLATPRFFPGAGVFADGIGISLRSSPDEARIFYTTDGSEPTENSARYRKPVFLEATAVLKAVAHYRGKTSAVAEASYVRRQDDPVPLLASGVPATQLSGNRGSWLVFKLHLPEDSGDPLRRLRIETMGGKGDTALYLRRSSPPTGVDYDERANKPRNTAVIDISDATAGDWYVAVRGISSFSGLSLLATVVLGAPDLVVWRDSLEPYVTTEVFDAEDCTVIEGHAVAGERRLLRFSTESRNVGGKDVVLGAPEDNPHWFEYHDCHGHHHFLGFAGYRLLDSGGNVAADGGKVSFCLVDVARWSDLAPMEGKFTCDYQGIQAGWSDIYDSGLEGQWIDITGVLPGDYVLEVTVNPDRLLIEGDYLNNTTTIPVSIPAP